MTQLEINRMVGDKVLEASREIYRMQKKHNFLYANVAYGWDYIAMQTPCSDTPIIKVAYNEKSNEFSFSTMAFGTSLCVHSVEEIVGIVFGWLVSEEA